MKKDELIFLAIAATVLGASLSYEVKSQRFHPRPTAEQASQLERFASEGLAAPAK